MQPLIFHPITKQRRWGGNRLSSTLGKSTKVPGPWGESWEIVDQAGDQSVVMSGELAGSTLGELVRLMNTELFGSQAGWRQFPLLIKFLDVHDWLSLQVHPDDTRAKQYGETENGKTESWIVLNAREGSRLYAGLKDGVTRDDLQAALDGGTIEETLHSIDAKPGDCIHVPAGTVHAIGPDIMLAEVQQQSDLTFRIHDWGRMGTDGKPRQLHLEQALECTRFDVGPLSMARPTAQRHGDRFEEQLVRCEHYEIKRHESPCDFVIHTQSRFRVLMVIDGSATLRGDFNDVAMPLGTTTLIPACVPAVEVCPSGSATVLEISVPTADG